MILFDGYGITKSLHSTSSVHGMDQTIALAQSDFCGLCFTNLVDFDALWGHRRNPIGYGEEIERFDKKLGELMPLLQKRGSADDHGGPWKRSNVQGDGSHKRAGAAAFVFAIRSGKRTAPDTGYILR